MTRYLEIVFRNKLRLLVLVVMLPLAFSALNLYLWRSYSVSESVWVDDPSTFGQNTASSIGFDPYSTPAQNYARLFSNLLGTQSFNNAVGDELQAEGVINSDQERIALISSLSQLAAIPGRATSAGGGAGSAGGTGGAAAAGDHVMTIRYVCSRVNLCLSVLAVVLDIFRSQYADLKARAATTARAIYQQQLNAAEADVAAVTAAIQKYEAAKPKSSGRTQVQVDPVLTALQHDLDAANKAVDTAKTNLQSVDTITQVSNGMAKDLSVVDGPKMQDGLYGIKGFGSDNLKSDSIAWASCLLMAVAYLILVAFIDRSVREPDVIKNKFAKPVVVIPAYQSRPRTTPLNRLKKLKKSA